MNRGNEKEEREKKEESRDVAQISGRAGEKRQRIELK